MIIGGFAIVFWVGVNERENPISCFGEICIYAPEFPYNPLFKNFYLSHDHDCNATSAAAHCIAPKLFSSDQAQVVPRLGSALYDTMAPDNKERWVQEIWKHVEARVDALKKQTPGGKTPSQWEKICEQVKTDMTKNKEARNIPFNMAHLSDPGQAAIPEDLLEISKVIKSAKYYFWDSNAKCPKVPQVWPRGRNVPIAIFSEDIAKASPFQHFGHCSIVAGFFWSWAQAIQNPEWKSMLPKFEALCINALADYTFVRNQQEVNILAFNAVEGHEESRENDGFTGARKALLVEFAVKNVKKAGKPGAKVKYDEVAAWLKSNIKFHDENAAPSANTCRDLHAVSSLFLKNKRAFAAYQEAETLWGRSTLFDEYSKMVILVQKCRNPSDLAFVAEWLLADMKANCGSPPDAPDKVSQARLKEVGGPICIAQATKDAVQWLMTTDVPPSWAPHSDLLQELAQPSRFRELFPAGVQTPETTVKLLAGCPGSIKDLANILKMVHGSSHDWSEKLKGFINGTRLWSIPTEKLNQLFEVFAEDWTLFQEACCDESGKPKPKKGVLPEDPKKKDAGKTAPDAQEDTKDKSQEVLELAREKARAVYTNPGVMILRPERWETAALGVMMKQQLTFEDLGSFTGFYFVDSDRLARVHPSQNKCLRHAPVSRARLLHFCQAMDTVMTPNKDTVVIGVGRAEGNAQTILELVGELGWSHKPIDVISTRENYDTFIKSGSAKKKRRLHRGLATVKYIQTFMVCWKPSRDSASGLSIKSGTRQYVDIGSSIASDCMMEAPVVQLKEIYEVTVDMQQRAFGGGGVETPEEASKAPDAKDFTTSHLSMLT